MSLDSPDGKKGRLTVRRIENKDPKETNSLLPVQDEKSRISATDARILGFENSRGNVHLVDEKPEEPTE
ncbi:MAG: hypothetical protein Q7S01_00225 [bacterium]|nr:hypothetical protein [bacterium]